MNITDIYIHRHIDKRNKRTEATAPKQGNGNEKC